MRINQFLARSGIASRRKAEAFIESGLVLVNGQVITDLAYKVDPENDEVICDDAIVVLPTPRYYLLNKPTGYVTTKSDPYALHTIFELLPEDPSLIAVGRLDRDTAGLILITNDGEFAQRVIHPSREIEKEYLVRTLKPMAPEQLKELKKGIELDDGLARAKDLKKISDKEFSMVIEMGRNRIVRRMIAALGNKVTGLKRVRIGNLTLDTDSGSYRELTTTEVGDYA